MAVERLLMKAVRIAIIGDYNPSYISHPQTGGAIEAASRRAGLAAEYAWVGTDALATDGLALLTAFDGFWIAPGGPYRSLDGALDGIRHARLSGKPFVGT